MSARTGTPRPAPTRRSPPERSWTPAQVAVMVASVVTALGSGCAPALDWREARIDGSGLLALFPCRPVAQTRQVALAGRQVSMQLHGCETGGRTFAVVLADMGEPAAVAPALQALRQASQDKTGGAALTARAVDWPAPPGATPQVAAGRWRLALPPDGKASRLDTALFARGTWVVQATVIGPQGNDEVDAPFFEGLRFAP